MTISCFGLFISMITFHVKTLPINLERDIDGNNYTFHIAEDFFTEGSNWAVIKNNGHKLIVDLKCNQGE